jgi:hypothetical protein
MKINNASRSDILVVYSGGDEKRIMNVMELAGSIEFQITDSNLVPLDLLDELFITFRLRTLPHLRRQVNPSIRYFGDSPEPRINPGESEVPH